MNPPSGSPTRRRADAYFAASYEVARRLGSGQGQEAIAVLRRELERTQGSDDVAGRRFLLSQIALCHSRMGDTTQAQAVLEEMEDTFPQEPETALMLAEGYLLLVGNADRASHHAALALQWIEEDADENVDALLSRGHSLMARALLAQGDVLGAFGAWQSAPRPDWRLGVDLIDAGHDPRRVRDVLVLALPRQQDYERQNAGLAPASADQMHRLILWIDAGCPREPQQLTEQE